MISALVPMLAALLANDGGTSPTPAQKPTGKPAAVGSLSKDEIKKVMQRHNNEVRHCYEQSMRTRPQLAGKVTVRLIVGATGDVLEAEIASDTTNDENLKNCMLTVVRSWKFPEPKGGGNVTISYPWSFAP